MPVQIVSRAGTMNAVLRADSSTADSIPGFAKQNLIDSPIDIYGVQSWTQILARVTSEDLKQTGMESPAASRLNPTDISDTSILDDDGNLRKAWMNICLNSLKGEPIKPS